MKRFIQYIAFLVMFFAIIFSVLIVNYKYCFDNQLQEQRRDKYSGEETLFLGSSHARDAFMNGVIPNSYNLASSGFSLEESYKELFSVITSGYKLKTVVVSMSPFSLRKTNQLPDVTNVVFDLKEKYGHNIIMNFLRNPGRKEFLFYLPHKKLTQHFVDQLNHKRLIISAKDEYHNHTSHTDHFYGLKYFKLINSLCRTNDIRLIYVVTPFSNVYNDYVDNDKQWNEDLSYLKAHAQDYEYYNFSKFFSSEKKDVINFSNGSHVNKHGAVPFTKYFNSTVLKSNSYIVKK